MKGLSDLEYILYKREAKLRVKLVNNIHKIKAKIFRILFAEYLRETDRQGGKRDGVRERE